MKRRKKNHLVQLVLPVKKVEPESTGSDVARIRAQIAAERESAERALYSSAYGVSQHLFITRRMERMGQLQGELEELVSEEEAAQITVQAMGAKGKKKRKGKGP